MRRRIRVVRARRKTVAQGRRVAVAAEAPKRVAGLSLARRLPWQGTMRVRVAVIFVLLVVPQVAAAGRVILETRPSRLDFGEHLLGRIGEQRSAANPMFCGTIAR
jgi:hypothetical protein